jgi:hypothetical protein
MEIFKLRRHHYKKSHRIFRPGATIDGGLGGSATFRSQVVNFFKYIFSARAPSPPSCFTKAEKGPRRFRVISKVEMGTLGHRFPPTLPKGVHSGFRIPARVTLASRLGVPALRPTGNQAEFSLSGYAGGLNGSTQRQPQSLTAGVSKAKIAYKC